MDQTRGMNDYKTPVDAPAPMHPLARYLARHAARPASQTPDADLLLLSIAQDTNEMLMMCRENQAAIRAFSDMNNTNTGEQHDELNGRTG